MAIFPNLSFCVSDFFFVCFLFETNINIFTFVLFSTACNPVSELCFWSAVHASLTHYHNDDLWTRKLQWERLNATWSSKKGLGLEDKDKNSKFPFYKDSHWFLLGEVKVLFWNSKCKQVQSLPVVCPAKPRPQNILVPELFDFNGSCWEHFFVWNCSIVRTPQSITKVQLGNNLEITLLVVMSYGMMRQKNTGTPQQQHLLTSMKHGGVSIMTCGCFRNSLEFLRKEYI